MLTRLASVRCMLLELNGSLIFPAERQEVGQQGRSPTASGRPGPSVDRTAAQPPTCTARDLKKGI